MLLLHFTIIEYQNIQEEFGDLLIGIILILM